MSAINELNDSCFVLATESLAEISKEFKDEIGRKPTAEELGEILAWGLRSCTPDLLQDVPNTVIESVIIMARKRKSHRLVPGDVVAVPASGNRYYLGVFITSNRFGCAYGFFRSTWPMKPIGSRTKLDPLGPPIYSGDESVKSTKWKVIAHRPDLLKLFPDAPEIYHAKKFHMDDNAIGKYGAAENPGERLRNIDAKEAEEVGLLDGSYRVVHLEEDIPIALQIREKRLT
jgi:hypothetical protein